MKRLGWEQMYESTDDSYKFKWVQCGRSINWNSFREGLYLLNSYYLLYMINRKENISL